MASCRQLPSGKYQARVTTPEGKRITLGTFRLKKECENASREYEAQFKGANHAENLALFKALEKAKVTTFGDLANRYIENRELTTKTKESYRDYLDKYLQAFNHRLIRQITREEIEDWWRGWGNRSPKHRKNIAQFLNAVLNYAVDLDYITRNPCKIPRLFAKLEPTREKQQPTQEQVRHIIALANTPNQRLAYIIAFHAGLRIGEIAELRKKDLVFNEEDDRWVLNCSRSVSWLKGGIVEVKPRKNRKAYRVPLSRDLNDEIRSLLKRLGTIDPEALIYPKDRELNNHFSHSQLNRLWKKLRDQVGYTGQFHDARRFVNNWLYAIGGTQREAMDRLGQTTIQANQVYQLGLGRDGELADKLPSIK